MKNLISSSTIYVAALSFASTCFSYSADLDNLAKGIVPIEYNIDEGESRNYGGSYTVSYDGQIPFTYDSYKISYSQGQKLYYLTGVRIEGELKEENIKLSGILQVNIVANDNINIEALKHIQVVAHENHHRALLKRLPYSAVEAIASPDYYAVIEGHANRAAINILTRLVNARPSLRDDLISQYKDPENARALTNRRLVAGWVLKDYPINRSLDITYRKAYVKSNDYGTGEKLFEIYETHKSKVKELACDWIGQIALTDEPCKSGGEGILYFNNHTEPKRHIKLTETADEDGDIIQILKAIASEATKATSILESNLESDSFTSNDIASLNQIAERIRSLRARSTRLIQKLSFAEQRHLSSSITKERQAVVTFHLYCMAAAGKTKNQKLRQALQNLSNASLGR